MEHNPPSRDRDRVSMTEPVSCGQLRTLAEQAGYRHPGELLTAIYKDWLSLCRPVPSPDPPRK